MQLRSEAAMQLLWSRAASVAHLPAPAQARQRSHTTHTPPRLRCAHPHISLTHTNTPTLQVVLVDVLCIHPQVAFDGLERCMELSLGLAHLLATTSVRVYEDSSLQVLHEMIKCGSFRGFGCWSISEVSWQNGPRHLHVLLPGTHYLAGSARPAAWQDAAAAGRAGVACQRAVVASLPCRTYGCARRQHAAPHALGSPGAGACGGGPPSSGVCWRARHVVCGCCACRCDSAGDGGRGGAGACAGQLAAVGRRPPREQLCAAFGG